MPRSTDIFSGDFQSQQQLYRRTLVQWRTEHRLTQRVFSQLHFVIFDCSVH